MSATPWVEQMGLRGAECEEHQPPVTTAVCLACLAKQRLAFDALLAVAKAGVRLDGSKYTVGDLASALDALDAAHPDWREWTP